MITRQEFLSGDKSHFEGPPGGAPYVLLQISDTGMGMSQELQSHIFEPFFTTKDVGKGTGLGLSTAYGVVEQAGGYIHVESAPNEGATFRIYFPQATATLAETSAEDGRPVPTGDETVLLVEDETGIRTMTRAYLESLGYRVLEAANGREALQLSRQYQNVIALLVSDYLMPGMRGDELVRAMHQERPGISALLVSGFPEVHSGPPNADVLEKPFTLPDLGRRVRDVLDRPQQEVRQEAKPRKRRPA